MINRNDFMKELFKTDMFKLTSDYGPRWGRIHRGSDYIIPLDRYGKIYAPCNAIVTAMGYNSVRGYFVEFLIAYRGKIRYCFLQHLKKDSIKVKIGQRVPKGLWLANIGSTGSSTGPHLHIEFTYVSYVKSTGRIPMPPFDSDKYGAGFYTNFSWPVYYKLKTLEANIRIRTYPDVDDPDNIVGELTKGKEYTVYQKKTADGFIWARLSWVDKKWSAIRSVDGKSILMR